MFCFHFCVMLFFYQQSPLWVFISGMLAQVAFRCTLELNIRKNSLYWSQLSAETVSLAWSFLLKLTKKLGIKHCDLSLSLWFHWCKLQAGSFTSTTLNGSGCPPLETASSQMALPTTVYLGNVDCVQQLTQLFVVVYFIYNATCLNVSTCSNATRLSSKSE